MRSQIWECIVACLKENGKYETPHKVHILGFGVPNAKNLAYGTPAMDALNPHLAHHPKSLKYHHMLLILKRPLQK